VYSSLSTSTCLPWLKTPCAAGWTEAKIEATVARV
jgi:hypothetical protein